MEAFVISEYKKDDCIIRLLRHLDGSYIVTHRDVKTFISDYDFALAEYYEEICRELGAMEYITSPDQYITI